MGDGACLDVVGGHVMPLLWCERNGLGMLWETNG